MTPPSHVLMTADAVGGVWTYSMELARALATAGARVSLAVMGAPVAAYQRAEAAAIPGLQLFENSYRLEWMDDPWGDVDAAADWLLDLQRQLKPDVIHLNGYAHGDLPWSAPCVVVAHSCVVSWWHAVHRADPPPEWSEYRKRVGSGLLSADATAAVSNAMAHAIRNHYGAPLPQVVWNCAHPELYRSGVKEDFVLSSGRAWDEAKNIRTLDAAARSIRWPVCLAGETRHPSGGAAPATNLRVLGRLGSGELRSWFARAAIYALPAVYEPFGLSVLEAALSGCAPVLGDIASLRELWQDAAIFVPPRDPEALASAVNSLIADPARRRDLAERAHARALTFTPEKMLHGYLALYSRAMERHAAVREAMTSCAS